MLTTRNKRMMLAATIGAACAMPLSVTRADEFGSNTPYYEDDAWYDVSEWFDGNDYNPTDEAIGRWDDEVFSFADNLTSSDNDNFLNWGDYGYDAGNDSDWFYDYYDDGYSSWDSTDYSVYYDTDDDGLYDAYSLYSDSDGDGFYEYFNYYTFDSSSDGQDQSQQQAKNRQKQMRSTAMQVSGNVENTKTVQVRDRKHLVAMVKQPSGTSMMVDLGPEKAVDQVSKGNEITASGHVLGIGDKSVLIAKEASMNNGSIAIDRNGREYQGQIETTKTVSIKGNEHTLAKVKTNGNKTMMVDFGPTGNLDRNFKQGDKVTIQGVPVKVKDRVLLMARQVSSNGEDTQIQRRVAKKS